MFKQRGSKGAIIRDLRTRLRSLNRRTRRVLAFTLSGFLTLGLITAVPTPSRANTCTSPQTSTSGNFTIVRFTNVQTCTWTVPAGVTSVDFLVVGGGGGGGSRHSGGGGAGGLRTSVGTSGGGASAESSLTVQPGSVLSVTVGAGGAGKTGNSGGNGSKGGNSTLGTITAEGGGTQTETGGSGGGANCAVPNCSVGSGRSGQGFSGATGVQGNSPNYWAGGGGGGAGGLGSAAAAYNSSTLNARGGVGGAGLLNSITGSQVCYAAGGAGGFHYAYGQNGNSGVSGGGCGSGAIGGSTGFPASFSNLASASEPGAANTGSGGGGGGFGPNNGNAGATEQNYNGGAGGSGVVIVRYQSPTAVSAPNSVAVTSSPLALGVSWSAPTKSAGSVTGYQVEYSTTGTASGTWTVASSSIAAGTTSYTISGLSSSTAYYVRVAARYSSGLGPYGYPWTSKYRTTTPMRSGNNIVYASGSAGQAQTSFSRVRYVMGATLNGSVQSVDANFDRAVSGSGNLNSIANLQVPTETSGSAVQGNVSDLTVISSTGGLVTDGHGLTGRLELWGSNYAPEPAGRQASNIYDDYDTNWGTGSYGSFQLHNLESTSRQTIFAWNRHGSSPEIGFGNHTGTHSDWTFCAESGLCPNRTNFSLEIFTNDPITPQVGPALTPTFGASTTTPVGYTFQITNYDGAYTWTGSSTASGTVAISGTGLVTVTGLAPSTSSTTTINTTRTGYTSGTANTSGTSSGAFLSYNFSDLNSYNSASPGTVTDLSGNARTGTITNGSGGATTTWTQSTGSLSFPGGSSSTGPFIDVPNILTTPFNTHGVTLDFEASFGSGKDNYERIIDFSEGGSGNDNLIVYRFGTSSDLYIGIYTGASGAFCNFANAISENVLTRYTITANGSTCQLWKNGTSVSSQAFTARIPAGITWSDNFIGKSNWTNDAQYEGVIRSLRLYSGPFTPTQIGALDYKTITYSANGGSTTPASGITSGSIRLPAEISRTGYAFQGWFSGATKRGDASASYTPTASETVQAGWTANPNTVTFNSNFTGGPTATTQSITTDVQTALTANTFTRTGYTFASWNTAANGSGTTYANGANVTINAALPLFAQWTANPNTVTFNSNYTGGPTAITQSITTDAETALTANTLTRSGYTFAGWNTAANGTGTPYTNSQNVTLQGPLTLFAVWYRISITTQPVGKESGTTLQTQPIVRIEDGNGATVTSDSTTSVTVAISSGAGGTLGGTRTLTVTNGVATFTNLTLAGTVGTNYVLTFTSTPAWNAAVSQNVTVTPGAVSASNSTVTPGTATLFADGVSTQKFTVTLKDAQGNTFATTNDSVTFARSNSLGTFGTTVNTAPGVYEGTYTSGTSPGTDTITVTANTINLSTQPVITLNPGIPSASTSTVTAASTSLTANGSSTSVVTIRLKDSSGNNIPRGGEAVTIQVSSGPGSIGSVTDNSDGTYSATYTSSTTAGTATLVAAISSSDITDTETITLNPGTATKLGVTLQPSITNASGAVLSTQPRIAVQDAFGNTVTSDTGRSITVGLIGNSGTITGTQTVSTSSGIAIFSGITLAGLISENYRLSFSAEDLTGINSDLISVTPGTASASTSTVTASTNSIVADGATTSTITVQLKDAQGNLLTTAGGTVVVSKASGGGTISETTNNNNGTYTATFTSATTVGTTVIQATVGGSTITDTETITLRHGVANKLVITQAPVAGASSSLLTTQPQVTLQDVNGNTVTSNSVDSVTVAISSGANGTLTGTKTLVLSSGVAAFTDLNLAGKTGTNYVLRFESGLFSTTSANIQVAAGAASTVTSNVAVSSNSLTANGTTTSTITVTLRDSESNQLATGGQTVALSVTSGFGSIGIVTDNEDGTYTATYTSGTTVGTATISATLNTAAIAETQTITLVHGPATKVTITQQPATGASGTSLTTQPKVVLRDANNNIATSDSSSTVTVAITSGSNGSLTGTKTVTVVAGEAVFTDLSFAGIVGTDYKLRFSSGSLTVADSNNLRVTPGVAVVGTSTITASSSSITANGVSTSTITVQLKDAQGNSLTINDEAVSIRVDSGTGNVGSTLPAGNGTYTATFTSSTTAGTSTIRATLGGADITASQDISLTPGEATKLGILTEPPSTTSSGVVLANQPRIAIQDAFGNTVTSDSGRSVVIGVVGNDGSVGGTTTRTSASGIVTFSGISLAGLTSNGYRLSFTTSGLTGVNSQIITLTPGAASTATSVVSASTTLIVADGSTTSTITITLKDAQGNLLRATGGTVVVSKASGDGSISTTTDNGNGTYTATFTSPTAVGTTVIQATVGGSTITDTESITLVHGDATQIKITQTPITGANASDFTRQPKITLFDANNNVVTSNSSGTVEVALFSGDNGTLSGTTQATFTNGVASFTDLAITGRTSTDYVLRFTAGSFTVDSANLTLTPGVASAATSTVVISDSTLIANGSSTATVTVRLKDAQTNALTSSGGTVVISVAIEDGEISTVLDNNDGTYTATYTSGTVVGTKTISASVNSVTLTDTEQVTLVPGLAAKILITQQPDGTSSGTALGTQPIVEITDAFNNRVTGDSSTQVTAEISSGAGGTLGGTRTVTAALGLATFTDVTLAGLVSQSYKLTFSSGSLTVIESSSISVTPGVAVASTSTISASDTSITADGETTSAITVQLKDAQGNSLTTSGGTVGMRIASGTGTLDSVSNVGNGTYISTYTSSQIAGAIEIRASLGGVELTEVQNLTLTPGAATKLAIYQAPISQRSGEVLSTQPKISVQDQFGNVVTGDSGRVVTVAITAGNGGSLDGTLTATTVNGIATFTNVVLAGITTSNYVLSFTTPNLTSVNSGVLTVSSGSAQVATSTFGVLASSIVANGVTTSLVTVTIRDAKENALTASAGTVEMFVTSGHQGSIGAVTNNGDGTYTATYTSGTLVSNSTITAKLNGVALTQSATISLTAGPATQIAIATQPVGSASGTALSQQPVIHLLDAFGNHAIQDSTTSVTAAINSGSFGSLGGSTIKQASQGVVTFTDLTLAGRVSENYKLRFSSGSLVVADSNNVTVTPGAPSTATSLVSSAVTTLVAETSNTTTVTITLKDAQGNLLTTGGATVGLAVSPVTSGFTNLGNVGSVTDRSNGTYTATYTAGTKVQSVRFSATLGGAAITDTSQLSLTHGAAYQIAVQTNPVGGASGSQLTTQPVVIVQDRHGNTVTSDNGTVITAALGGFQNTGTLSGTRTAVTSNGQAAFAGIVMSGRINTQYVLAFTSSGLVAVNSANYTISQGPTNVTNSAIEADAAAIVANGTATTVITVSIKDTEGNVVAASAGTVALTVAQGTGSLSAVVDNNNGTYTSTFTAGTVSGTARIIGTLNGSALGGTASIILTSGPAENAQILVAPGTSASGALLNPQPQIVIKDVNGNTVTSDSSTVVTLSLKSGDSGTLAGTLTATASSGIAQFSNVTLSGLVGTNYVLEFDPDTSGVRSIDSAAINLTPGTPTQLVLTTPAATANSGQAFVTQPVLTAKDAQGNVATNFTADVTASVSGATLQGSITKSLANGVATFTDLGMFGTANASYQVTYATSALNLSANQSLLLNPGPANNLLIVSQPSTEMNGRAFVTQPVIQIRDAQNNEIVTDTPVSVVASINTGSGTLSGATSVATNSAGRATFTDLMVTGNTGSYTLTFAVVGLSIDSNSFALTPGDQTITRSTFGSTALPNGTYTPTATAYSGLSVAISIASTSATVCSIEDGEVTFLKMGDCAIKYNQTGNTHWSPAAELIETLSVGRLTQTTTFAAIDDQPFGGTDVALTATAQSGLLVTFAVTSASTVCVLNTATTVQIVGLGTCTVVASQSGDEVWAPAGDVTRSFVIGTVRPATPTVSSVSAGNAQATISWNPPTHNGGSPILGYRVTARIDSVSTDLTCETTNSTDSSCIVTGLTNGTEYTFVVQALNAIGYSNESTDSPEVTPATTADAVVGLTLTSTNKKLTANWIMPEQLGGGNFVRFEMFIRETGGTYGDAFTSNDANLTTFDFTKLDPNDNTSASDLVNGESYDVKIVIITDAIMAGDQSVTVLAGNSTEATQVPADVASAPTNATILTTDGTQASVSWIASSSNGGAVITAYSVTATANNVAVTCVMQLQLDTSCEISSLTPGQVINVSIRAVNRIGNSVAATASMKLPTPPAPPTMNAATAGSGFIQVTWAVPASDGGMALTGYVAKAMVRGTNQVVAECTTIGTSCDLMVSGTEFDFDFAVWSMNRVGMSDSSNMLSPKRPTVSPTPTPSPSGPRTRSSGTTNTGAAVAIFDSRRPVFMPNGELPELNVGTTMAWRNGEFVEVNLVSAGTSALQLSAGGGVVLQMQTLHQSGQPMDVAANGMLQVFHNHSIRIAGSGFAPNTMATVWLFSDPVKLGEIATDPNGGFAELFAIDTSIPLGDHTIQINGRHTDGSVRTVAMGVSVFGEDFAPEEVVTEASGASDSDSNQVLGVLGAVGLAFLGGIGVGILMLGQRRRKSSR